ncbi:MAG: aa3-type cytochrome c oxidase subunit IV [Pseudomonadota bacterium]
MATEEYHVDHEKGADMDYKEHESTYEMFLTASKWGVIFNVALLLAMAVGFFMGGGFVGGFLTFVVLMIAAKIIA